METNFELTREDFEHLSQRTLKERAGKIFGAAMGICFILSFGILYSIFGLLPALIGAVAATGLYALTAKTTVRYAAAFIYKAGSRSPVREQATVRLEPDRLITATPLIKTEIRWDALTKIAEDEKGFYLYLNPVQIIMVPRRVFASAEQAQAFWTLIQEYYEYARRAPIRA